MHAAILGLLDGAIPLKAIATSTLLAIPQAEGQDVIVDPSPVEADRAKSLHALAFTSQDELLLSESEGIFTPDEWTKVLELGQRICCHHQETGLDTAMDGDGAASKSMKDFIRSVMETKIAGDLHWK